MGRLIRLLLSRCMLALLFSASMYSGAVLADDIDRVRELRSTEQIQPLSKFLNRIKQEYPDSTILDAEVEEEKGRIVYEIKIVDRNHHVHELEFDAVSGKLFEEHD